MTYLHAIILGLVEGITEFLPISSTGHLILASKVLGIENSNFLKSFEIIIQMGAILAVVVLYFRKFFSIPIITRLICGFIPTGIIGLTLYPFIKGYLLGNAAVVMAALALGGLFLILFETFHHEAGAGEQSITDITYKQAFLIGLFQSVAIIPGVSRSAATIVGGLFLGLKRVTVVEFSFLLAVPTMVAATGLDLLKNHSSFSTDMIGLLLVGFIISFVVALFVIAGLLRFIKKHTFIPFGVYRIIVAIIFVFIAL
jgi:undecaprenyl-diphosphatase